MSVSTEAERVSLSTVLAASHSQPCLAASAHSGTSLVYTVETSDTPDENHHVRLNSKSLATKLEEDETDLPYQTLELSFEA